MSFKLNQVLKICIFTMAALIASTSLCLAATYYASPNGNGNGRSQSSPFQIADFWGVASPGDTLYLLDGVYKGSRSMIDPPNGKSGRRGDRISIESLNDGKALIDGEYRRVPVYLRNNDYWNIIGINARRSSNDVYKIDSGCNQVSIKRCIGWDSNMPTNSSIFGQVESTNILIEDCAGWGKARKIYAPWHCDGIIYRRNFGRNTFCNWNTMYMMSLSFAYGSTNTLTENCIMTWDETGYNQPNNAIKDSNIGFDQVSNNGGYEVYGCIGYNLNSQLNHPKAGGLFTGEGSRTPDYILKDSLFYCEPSNMSTFKTNNKRGSISYSTFIGGGYFSSGSDSVVLGDPLLGKANHLIVMNSARHGINRCDRADYVAFSNNRNGPCRSNRPKHYTTDGPDLIKKCGNILQYGLAEEDRPKVNGQSVGAKIQNRYVNGKLTNESLWPWPMNKRIAEAMRISGYDTRGGLDGKGEINLTKTIFELNGGSMPSSFDSEAIAPPENLRVIANQ